MSFRYARPILCLGLALLLVTAPSLAQEQVDEDAVAAIRKHGLDSSQVMETLSWLTDVYGPRLTGSPNLDKASAWALDRMAAWGLQNGRLGAWGPFGRGWTLEHFSLHVTGDNPFPVVAYPRAWSPGTGLVEGEVVIFNPVADEEFAAFQGQLAGKFVLIEEPRTLEEPFERVAERRDAENLLELANAATTDVNEFNYSAEAMQRMRLQQKRMQFLYEEKPLAVVDRYFKGEYGTLFSAAVSLPAPPETPWYDRPRAWTSPAPEVIPHITLAVEHYNRIYRLVEKGLAVALAMDLRVTFHEDDPMEYNVIAEIPGTDPQIGDEVVMLGAHLDSWHAGTGATDNGAGSAVVMEATRILQEVFKEMGASPRRTIRVALWSGEEQGLLGSRAYVNEHFAEIEGWGQPPTALKPDHDKLSAYFNLDNGTGKIRGVYLQGNEAVRPIFAAWLAPFKDLGAGTLTISNTGGTDHLAFDAAGLPGFQFIQDPIAYSPRTHHSNMDVFDHALEDDLKQAATIMASFAYHAAQRDEMLPRKPLPTPDEPVQAGSD